MKGLSPDPDLVERFRSDVAALGDAGGGVGVAVSGGPDSLALLLLAAAAFPGKVSAATVDHGLRAESAAEAAMVGDVCRDLGLAHVVLPVEVAPRSSLQRAAREARYAALANWLARDGIGLLATAHHADDQAETLLMRLLRGSGVGGLASIRAKSVIPVAGCAARLIRPLLGWRRSELAALVAAAGLTPADDSSNRDSRFDRVRVRAALATVDWIEPLALARSAAALAEADEALAWTLAGLRAERVTSDGTCLRLRPDGLPAELKRRLVSGLLQDCAPGGPRPRGEEIGRLIARLESGGTATLGGVICSGGPEWRFTPENRPDRR
jgi:tRNA(Ile)-lysidine synthase